MSFQIFLIILQIYVLERETERRTFSCGSCMVFISVLCMVLIRERETYHHVKAGSLNDYYNYKGCPQSKFPHLYYSY